jgi:hypothetical protein
MVGILSTPNYEIEVIFKLNTLLNTALIIYRLEFLYNTNFIKMQL